MNFQEKCENLTRVDRIWLGISNVYFVSFWYRWYGIQCENVCKFNTYKEALSFQNKMLERLAKQGKIKTLKIKDFNGEDRILRYYLKKGKSA